MQTHINPFTADASSDLDDRELVRRAQAGEREALEQLIRRHQAWIYNIALRMILHPQDAEDATQELLILVVTKLSTFEGRSSFRTWMYRIVVNHVLNLKRKRGRAQWTFTDYAEALNRTPDLDVPDTSSLGVDAKLLIEEAGVSCTSGMLLCFDPPQRLVYILGEILGVPDSVGGELLEITPDNFRQRLSRARRDLYSFMNEKCGLVNTANPCRCAKKTQGFIKAGYVDPKRLVFVQAHVAKVRDVAPRAYEELDAMTESYAAIHRDHGFLEPPDFVAALRQVLDDQRLL